MSTSVSVCLSVSLSVGLSARISPKPRARFLPNFLCIFCGSVLFRRDNKIPRGRISSGGFLPHWQCITHYITSIRHGCNLYDTRFCLLCLRFATRQCRRKHCFRTVCPSRSFVLLFIQTDIVTTVSHERNLDEIEIITTKVKVQDHSRPSRHPRRRWGVEVHFLFFSKYLYVDVV